MTDTRKPKRFNSGIRISSVCAFGSVMESEGPCGKLLDGTVKDTPDDGETWEKAESSMISRTVGRLLEKCGRSDRETELLLGGDLMNQCTSCAYGLEGFDIPYLGLYGACSTFALGVMTASAYIESGFCSNAIACASSHFCTAERQYRFPLSYGAFPQGTSQHTVTGCGAAFLEKAEDKSGGVYVSAALPGIVINRGITNASNMGAAMASAAADTIMRYLIHTHTRLCDYDLVATGDLGSIGLEMAKDIMKSHGFTDECGVMSDCGCMIYDLNEQEVSCGGSGCGCSAVTFCSYIYDRLIKKHYKRVLLIGTGAMMSPQSLMQGLSIPAVAHLVEFESGLLEERV